MEGRRAMMTCNGYTASISYDADGARALDEPDLVR